MAAPTKKMVVVSDDSSSSDEEALKRCQEAAWVKPSDTKKGERSSLVLGVRDEVNIYVETEEIMDRRR